MRKSKNRYFYHIFVSPGDAPGAITLNVVWMERQFDDYKLSRCMCPSNYNHFGDKARYLWNKNLAIANRSRVSCAQYAEGIYRHKYYTATLKSRLRVTGNVTIGQIIHDLVVVESFDVEYYCDLEIWLRGHSRSLNLVPFKGLGAVSYSPWPYL